MAMFAEAVDLQALLPDSALSDERAELLLTLSSAIIQSYTGQTIELVEDDAVSLAGTSDGILDLPQRPVVDVTAVTLNTELLNVDRYHLQGSGLYFAPGPVGSMYEDVSQLQGWGGPLSQVAVTYSHGFTVIPEYVRAACLLIAVKLLHNPASFTSENIGDYGYSQDAAASMIGPTERDLLKPLLRRVGTVSVG